MAQNLISLNFADPELAAIDACLTTLEQKFAGFADLSPAERKSLSKMGDKSEAFCRQTLTVLAQNTGILPPNYNLAEAQTDLANIDMLRPRFARLRALMEKADDTEVALGSDVMSAALEGYAQLKVSGKGAGLDALRQQIGARFAHASRKPAKPA
ncbi:MAG: hypothetical protein ABSA97_15415 [Verrucomicrobiia bacterium]